MRSSVRTKKATIRFRQMRKDIYQAMLEYAFNLISRKRYTNGELQKKIEAKIKKIKPEPGERSEDAAPGAIVEKIILRLNELEYLNDEQFVQDYIADRLKYKPRGIMAIKMELFKKGIEKDLIEKYLNRDNIDEKEAADRILANYARKLKNLPEKEAKRKIFQYLAGKGFRQDTIYKTIDSFYNCNVI